MYDQNNIEPLCRRCYTGRKWECRFWHAFDLILFAIPFIVLGAIVWFALTFRPV